MVFSDPALRLFGLCPAPTNSRPSWSTIVLLHPVGGQSAWLRPGTWRGCGEPVNEDDGSPRESRSWRGRGERG